MDTETAEQLLEHNGAPIEVIAALLDEREVVFADVPQAVKLLLLGFTLGRRTPPWNHATITRHVDAFFGPRRA